MTPQGRSLGLAYDRRNERVVEKCGRLVAVWTGLRRGGTFYTMCAAWERRISVEEVLLPGATDPSLAGRGV